MTKKLLSAVLAVTVTLALPTTVTSITDLVVFLGASFLIGCGAVWVVDVIL